MKDVLFEEQVGEQVDKLEGLLRRAKDLPAEEQASFLTEALEELSVALEELQVAGEELQQQNHELVAAREAVEEEHRHYLDLFHFAPDAYLVTDGRGMIREANEAAGKLLAVRPEFLVGKSLALFVVKEERASLRKRLNEIAGRKESWESEARFKPRRGLAFSAAVRAKAILDPKGQATAVRWIIRDITAHKRAEQMAKLASFPELNPNPVVEVDPNGNVRYLNPAARQLLPDLEASGLRHPFLAGLEGLCDTLERGKGRSTERRVKLGEEWYAQSWYRVPGTELLRIYNFDITARKRAEEALRTSEERFALLSDVAGRLLQADNPQEIVNQLCEKVMKHLDCQAYFNFLVDEGQGRLRLNAYAGIPEDTAREIEWLDYGVAVCGCAARDASRIVAEDIMHTPDERTDLVRSFGIQAYACHPLFAQGCVMGTLSFGTRTRTRFAEDELALMKTVADQVAVAMQRMSLLEAEKHRAEELEVKVRERTATLMHAQEAVRRNEELLRMVLETLPVGVVVADKSGQILLANPAAQEIWGTAKLAGGHQYDQFKGWWPDSGKRIKVDEWGLARALLKGETSIDEEREREAFDGQRKRVLASSVPVLDEQGGITGGVAVMEDVTRRREMERREEATAELLSLFVRKTSRKEYLDAAVELVQKLSGCRCVGVRVSQGEGYFPYESHVGFDQEFLESDTWLSVVRDSCACIRVAAGTPEPQNLPVMTPAGSFHCDNTLAFVEGLPEEEQRRFRGACVRKGYLSVVVVPLRFLGKALGAIHLADERKGMAPAPLVDLLESVAPLVGEAIHRFIVEEQLRENHALQGIIDSLLRLTLVEMTFEEMLDRALDVICAKPVPGFAPECALFLPGEEPDVLTRRSVRGFPGAIARECAQVPFGQCYCGQAASSRQIVMGETDGECAVPLVYGGQLLGVLHMHMKEGLLRDRRKGEMLSTLADVLLNVIEHRRAQEALRDSAQKLRHLSNELLVAQENERKAVAKEIHDSVGQVLAAVKFRVEDILGSTGEARTKRLKDLVPMIQECIEEVRRIQMALRPALLDDLGILATISWFCRGFEKTYKGIRIHKALEIAENAVPEPLKIVIFRILQEAFNNAAKHSRASLLRASLLEVEGAIELTVQDDGQGFDLEASLSRDVRGRGLGLTSMRERAELSDGTFAIESAPGRGTTVRARWRMP